MLIVVTTNAVGANAGIVGGWKLKGGWAVGLAGDRAQTLNNVTLVGLYRKNNDGPGWTRNRVGDTKGYPIPFKAVAAAIDLVIQDALHAHATDGIALTQVHVLAIADGLHSHFGDSLVLTQLHILAIQDSLHAHAGDNLVLTQAHLLAIQEALHSHAADNLTITENSAADLVIQDATHGHTTDGVALTQAHQLVVADALHAHAGDNLVLSQVHNLTIQDALHAHLGDNVALSIPGGGPGPNTDPPVRMRRRVWTG
jgi:uncharacterized protein Veg